MFKVAVKDHFMIAHSLKGEAFGPAQRMHGVTFNVTLELHAQQLDDNDIIYDIGHMQAVLQETIAPLHFRNLDELPQFEGKNTTTEFLACWLHGRIAEQLRGKFRGDARVVLEESHVAWGSYEAPID